jgi:putative peptidoglycan lipid II flippase
MSSRLVELPLGIFVASIVAVTFPSLSRSAGSGDCRSFSDGYVRAQRSLAMVTIPSAIGLILLGRPILILLFAWGNCAVSDLDQVLPALQISAAAIPFFASAGLLARVFHARQDMKSPMVVAAISIVANIIFTLILIGPFGATGMAAANSVSAMLQCALLRRKMEKRFGKMDCAFGSKWPLLWASLVLVLLILFVGAICGQPTSKCGILLWIAVTIPLAAIAYGTVLWLLGFGEVSLLLALVRPPKRRQFSH